MLIGVNKRNIRNVIVSYCPRSISEFVQLIGRSGRDGQPSVGQVIVQQQITPYMGGVRTVEQTQFNTIWASILTNISNGKQYELPLQINSIREQAEWKCFLHLLQLKKCKIAGFSNDYTSCCIQLNRSCADICQESIFVAINGSVEMVESTDQIREAHEMLCQNKCYKSSIVNYFNGNENNNQECGNCSACTASNN